MSSLIVSRSKDNSSIRPWARRFKFSRIIILITIIIIIMTVKSKMLKVDRSCVRFPVKPLYFSIYLILPSAPGPEVYSTSKRNEDQKHKNNNVSGE
jgi:Mn2+/Fe2+ NRAMP family transporter